MKKRSARIGVAASVLMTALCSGSAQAADGEASQTTVVTTTAPATTVQVKGRAIDTRRLSAELVSLAKLVQSGVDEKVVVTFIENSPPRRSPTAEELVYLHELGLSSDAMVALMNAVPKVSLTETQPVVAASSERIVEPLLAQRPYQAGGTVQSAPVNGNTVVSSPAPAPTVVYTQPAQPTVVYTQPAPPVIVQQEPVVTYVEPRPSVTFGFGFGHLFGHHGGGHYGGHYGGHHGGGHHGGGHH